MTSTSPEFVEAQGDDGGPDKTRLIIVGGLVAALALGAGGYLLLGGGGSSDAALAGPVKRAVPTKAKIAPSAATPAKPKAVAKPQVPPVSAVKLGRDPFLALYTVPVAAPAAPPADTTTTATPTSSAAPAAPASAPYALTLKSIGTSGEVKTYTFSVDGQSKTVIPAQKFGKYGELVVLAFIKNSKGDPVGALIQVGDDDPVGIKVGEKLTVL